MEGFNFRVPLPPLLESSYHQVQFEVWTGPGGTDGVRAKHATSTFFVQASFGDAEAMGAEEPRYSTMRCVGGIQQFPFALQRADQFWGTLADEPAHATTPPDLARQRVCEFRSVCWARGAIIFFRDSDSFESAPPHVLLHGSPSQRGHGFLALSYMYDAPSVCEKSPISTIKETCITHKKDPCIHHQTIPVSPIKYPYITHKRALYKP